MLLTAWNKKTMQLQRSLEILLVTKLLVNCGNIVASYITGTTSTMSPQQTNFEQPLPPGWISQSFLGLFMLEMCVRNSYVTTFTNFFLHQDWLNRLLLLLLLLSISVFPFRFLIVFSAFGFLCWIKMANSQFLSISCCSVNNKDWTVYPCTFYQQMFLVLLASHSGVYITRSISFHLHILPVSLSWYLSRNSRHIYVTQRLTASLFHAYVRLFVTHKQLSCS